MRQQVSLADELQEVRPRPVLGCGTQAGDDGIGVHIPAHLIEVLVGLDRLVLKPPLKEGPRAVVGPVEVPRIPITNVVHKGRDNIICRRLNDQMEVVDHQYDSNDGDTESRGLLVDNAHKHGIVGLGPEDGLLSGTSIDDVHDTIATKDRCTARHDNHQRERERICSRP